jgi:hypothetical protein
LLSLAKNPSEEKKGKQGAQKSFENANGYHILLHTPVCLGVGRGPGEPKLVVGLVGFGAGDGGVGSVGWYACVGEELGLNDAVVEADREDCRQLDILLLA